MSDELEDLKKRVAELERVANPSAPRPKPQPIDWTQGMSMPSSAIRAMAAAVSNQDMAQIVREQSRPVTLPSVHGEAPKVPGTVVKEPRPDKRSEWQDQVVDQMTARLVGGPNDTSKLK